MKHKLFTEEVSKIALRANNDKRIQSINSIQTYVYKKDKEIIQKKKKKLNLLI